MGGPGGSRRQEANKQLHGTETKDPKVIVNLR